MPWNKQSIIYSGVADANTKRFCWLLHILCWVFALIITTICNPAVKGHLDNTPSPPAPPGAPDTPVSPNSPPVPSSPPAQLIAISDTTVAIGIAGTVCAWLGVIAVLTVAASLDHPTQIVGEMKEELNTRTKNMYYCALPVIFILTVFGTMSSLYVFCIGSQDPGSLFFWASLTGTSLMLFAQMLLLSNCQRLEITQATGSFSIACVVSIQFITALGVQGGDFNAHPIPIGGMEGIADMTFVMGGGISGVQKAVAWISPLLR